MFKISYETWRDVCEMYFSLPNSLKKVYLQWYPFLNIGLSERSKITSKEFYSEYIEQGAFVLFPNIMFQTDNFLQRSDTSFRESQLVSPLLYLILQSIGKEINEKYVSNRPKEISVYYSGDYKNMQASYKKQYDSFFKKINSEKDRYQFFIKTDVTDFFRSINVNLLIEMINKNCNKQNLVFSQSQLYFLKEMLIFCGRGKFPLIENSVALSFLATVVYLNEIDIKIHKFLKENMNGLASFQIVRYVDDMYILISIDENCRASYQQIYNQIISEYSSILKQYDLSLNIKKCTIKETEKINDEIKKSFYDEDLNIKKVRGKISNDMLTVFLEKLLNLIKGCDIDVEKYNNLIGECFTQKNIEFTASEIFNYFVYGNKTYFFKSERVVALLEEIIKTDIRIIALDPKRLTVLMLKTKDERIVKSFLNQLFIGDKNNCWNLYDTVITVTYLIQRGFKHKDLIEIISKRHRDLYLYYQNNCSSKFTDKYYTTESNRLNKVLLKDNKAYYLYFLYLCEKAKGNYLSSFAYYKNYFDRITADIECFLSKTEKKPNYKKFHKENAFKTFYKDINQSDKIISKAHQLRNENPLIHSSSGMLDKNNTSEEITESIQGLSKIVNEYLEKNL